jgi:DNA mismatch repair ATPase MutS
MRARLMFDDRDFHTAREPRVGEADLIADLELNTLWEAMARGDDIVRQSVRAAVLDGLTDPGQIRYRQAVLTDCLTNPKVVREIYALAVQAVASEKQVYRGMFNNRGEALVRRSITVLELFVGILEQLRAITDRDGHEFQSDGFRGFFDTIRSELDDDYFRELAQHLRQLRFRDGVLATAQLGKQGQGVGYVLRVPHRAHRLLRFRSPQITRPSFSWTIPPRDEGGGQAMGALRDRVLSLVADAVGESTNHMVSFFAALRTELAFYVGVLNLHDQLTAKGERLSVPDPHPLGGRVRNARALYDPCLSLRLPGWVSGSDLDGDGKPLIVVTGANQGGKSTFLRSVGLAQLMMQAGVFVGAETYAATVAPAVFTHYKRQEDATMSSGKFDEELARMSTIAAAIGTGDLLLCNESFAATNEREGSEIAGEVIRALTDTGNTVVFVTHLYEFAHHFHTHHAPTSLFLRAARDADGSRSFRITEGAPLPTSYGDDLYQQTFTDPSAGGPAPPREPVSAAAEVARAR